MDWFGAYIIGLVTAIGGGTLRDLLLDVTPFWMLEGKYFLTTGVALIATLLFKDKLFKWGSTLFLFDTIGLGLFTIVGITKSIAGLYALACVAGGGVYFLCNYLILPTGISETIAALTVIVFSLIAVKYHLHLPQSANRKSEKNNINPQKNTLTSRYKPTCKPKLTREYFFLPPKKN